MAKTWQTRLRFLGRCLTPLLLLGLSTVAADRSLAADSADRRNLPLPSAPPNTPQATTPKIKKAVQAPLDQAGDPLPPGARARLGTLRFRHSEGVSTLAYTPDGKALAAGGRDSVIAWDSTTGKELQRLRANGETALSPDGKSLACAWFGTVWMQDFPSGKFRWRKDGGTFRRPKLVFSPDSQVLAVGGNNDGVVRLHEVASGRPIAEAVDRFAHLTALAYAPDGKSLACAWDGKWRDAATVRVWTAPAGKPLWERKMKQNVVAVHLAYSPRGGVIAVSGLNHEGVWLWDASTGKSLKRMEPARGTADTFNVVAFSPDGKILVAGATDGAVCLWDSSLGKMLWAKKNLFEGRCSLAYAPDGKILAIGRSDGIASLLETASGTEIPLHRGNEAGILAMAFLPGGETLLTGGRDGTVRRWDVLSGRQLDEAHVARPRGESLAGARCALSPNGKTIAISSDEELAVWNMAGKRLWRKASPGGVVLTYSPNSKTLAVQGTSSHFCETKLFEVDSGKQIWSEVFWDVLSLGYRKAKFAPILAFSPDGTTLAVSAPELKNAALGRVALLILDAAAGRELRRIYQLGDCVSALTYASDGKTLAAMVNDSSRNPQTYVHLWEVITGRKAGRFRLSDAWRERVSVLASSPDGRTLACGGLSGSIWLWDLAGSRECRRFYGHSNPIRTLAFAPSGRSLASASADGTALIWDLSGANAANRLSVRDLNVDQLEGLWSDLSGDDAERAERAVWLLAGAPGQAISFLKQRLKPVASPNLSHLRRLISNLNANVFSDRARATQQIKDLGALAIPALRKALADKPSLEAYRRIDALLSQLDKPVPTLPAELLREYRAIRSLEYAGTAEAKTSLQQLAAGAPGAMVTREADAAVRRLNSR